MKLDDVDKNRLFIKIVKDKPIFNLVKDLKSKYNTLDLEDEEGRTLLMYICLSNDLNALKFMKSEINLVEVIEKEESETKSRAIHFAAENENSDFLKEIISFSSNIDSKDANGNTALSNAVFSYRGNGDNIKLLLKSGANPDERNNFGVSPKELAKSIANYDTSKYFIY